MATSKHLKGLCKINDNFCSKIGNIKVDLWLGNHDKICTPTSDILALNIDDLANMAKLAEILTFLLFYLFFTPDLKKIPDGHLVPTKVNCISSPHMEENDHFLSHDDQVRGHISNATCANS